MNRDEARMILLANVTQVDSSRHKHYTEGIEKILTELGFLDKPDIVHSLACPKCNSASNLRFIDNDCVGCDSCTFRGIHIQEPQNS